MTNSDSTTIPAAAPAHAGEPSPCLAPASELAADLRRRRIGACELVDAYLGRIEALNPALNAVVELDAEGARSRAAAADRALAADEVWGPLHGVPFTLKEMFDIAGLHTTWGDPGFRGHRASANSVVAQRLIDAGAILLGKTNLPENMRDWETHNSLYGGTRNPWNLGHSPGGSSGGSAAAVAAGLAAAEVGHEWGGSLRLPCHYCGVYGLNPTWGIVPNRGTGRTGDLREVDFAVAGPIARSPADLALILEVLAGADDLDAGGWSLVLPEPRHRDLGSYRVAAMLDHPHCAVDTAYRDCLQDVLDRLAAAGVRVADAARPGFDMDAVLDLFTRLVRAATSAYLPDPAFAAMQDRVARGDPSASENLARNERAATATHRAWLAAHEARLRMRLAWHAFFQDHDVLLCPAAATAAPRFDDSGNIADRTLPVNGAPQLVEAQHFWFAHACLGQLPAAVAPIGLVGGLPVGVQIVGPRFGDHTVIRFAELLAEVVGGYEPPPLARS